jgi:hypothetical protein
MAAIHIAMKPDLICSPDIVWNQQFPCLSIQYRFMLNRF